MRSDLAPDPSAARIRLANVAYVACGTSSTSAFPDALSACGVCVDKLIRLSLVILRTARSPPGTSQDDSTCRIPPSRR
jgi:hypothetical protein